MFKRHALAIWLIFSLCSSPACSETRDMGTAAAIPSEHAKAQVARLAQIRNLAAAGDFATAVSLIEAAKAESVAFAGSDPRRADALEMQVALMAARGAFSDARGLSEQVVKQRRTGSDGEQLLLSTSLLQHVIVMDGAGDTVAADKALQEAITAGGKAFPATDPRLPRMLEAFGDLLVRGYNRPLAGLRLYEAAVRMRELGPHQSPRELAETLRKMALAEPAQGRDVSADGHLERAIALLLGELTQAANASEKAELTADVATLLGSRTGLALRGNRFDAARGLLVEARAAAAGTPSAPYMELWGAELERREAEAKGAVPEALSAVRRGIGIARGLNDAGLTAGLQLIEGRMQIDSGDLAGAEATINDALKSLAGMSTPEGARTTEGWLLLARVERARGNEARASRWTTAALTMLKTRRSEVPVLFGTNRAPRMGELQSFGPRAGEALVLGEALVMVPGSAPIATAGLSTLGGATALERMLVVNAGRLDTERFQASAKALAQRAKLYPKTALVFVHGFGTTFDFALARAAQIGRDIAFDGPIFAFSWPSQGLIDPVAYAADERTAAASAGHLAAFLAEAAQASGAEKLHIVAHSMGSQVLLMALEGYQAAWGRVGGTHRRSGVCVSRRRAGRVPKADGGARWAAHDSLCISERSGAVGLVCAQCVAASGKRRVRAFIAGTTPRIA